MEQNPKKRLINALQGKTVDRIPFLSVTQTGTVELMDRTESFWLHTLILKKWHLLPMQGTKLQDLKLSAIHTV